MRSSPHAVGNINLRGKKLKALSCGCCDVYDLRGDYNRKFEMAMALEEAFDLNDRRSFPGQIPRRAAVRS